MRSTVSLQHQTTKRRIGFYIIINAIGLIAVLYIVDLEQFLEFINQISFVSIVLLFLIWLMISIFHAWRFTVILETAGQIKISIIRAIQYLQCRQQPVAPDRNTKLLRSLHPTDRVGPQQPSR